MKNRNVVVEPDKGSERALEPAALMAAAQKVVASVAPEPDTVTGRFLAELHRDLGDMLPGTRPPRRIWPPEILRDGKVVQFHPEKTLAAILRDNVGLVPSDVAQKLQAIENQMKGTYAEAVKFSGAAANERFQKQTADLTTSIVDGGTLPDEIKLRSREAIQADFRVKQAALTRRLAKLTEEAMTLCGPILAKVQSQIEISLHNLESADRALCEYFGVPYHSTPAWQALCNLAMRFTLDRVPGSGQWAFPSRILQGIHQFNSK